MILQRVLTVPIFLYIDKHILTKTEEILQQNNLIFDNPLILSGPTETKAIALQFIQYMNYPKRCLMSITSNTIKEVVATRGVLAERRKT